MTRLACLGKQHNVYAHGCFDADLLVWCTSRTLFSSTRIGYIHNESVLRSNRPSPCPYYSPREPPRWNLSPTACGAAVRSRASARTGQHLGAGLGLEALGTDDLDLEVCAPVAEADLQLTQAGRGERLAAHQLAGPQLVHELGELAVGGEPERRQLPGGAVSAQAPFPVGRNAAGLPHQVAHLLGRHLLAAVHAEGRRPLLPEAQPLLLACTGTGPGGGSPLRNVPPTSFTPSPAVIAGALFLVSHHPNLHALYAQTRWRKATRVGSQAKYG